MKIKCLENTGLNLPKSFFEQFEELLKKVPRMSLNIVNNVNSDYTSFA